ncbi:MAG: hypothetical protein PHH00_01915 [Candidatus Nanoarchaeia archaeon]|nr:hypothetical protein [Candidatus Nanoarchaeia archaeon]
MHLFGRKEKTVDWTENYNRQKDRLQNLKEGIKQDSGAESPASQSTGNFNFLANLASLSAPHASDSDNADSGENSDERKRKLARRLVDITEKIEDLSTQIYHLQQRVELLERKNKTGFE